MGLAIGMIYLFLVINISDAVNKLKLSSGHEMPMVGLGTGSIQQEAPITTALENGYRHFDTAFAYENEKQIGEALKKWFAKGGKREDLFITSKLPAYANKPGSVEKYLKRSLQDLGLDHVDMYLVHSPFNVGLDDKLTPYEQTSNIMMEDADQVALWKAMEAQVKAGRAKSIGLSNFNQAQVLNVYNSAEIKPSNLQVESHPYLQQKELRNFCKDKNIVMTAYAPLGSPRGSDSLTDQPLIKEVAEKYKKTPGQVVLRYSIQNGLVVVPKSSNPERQKNNIEVFDFKLTDEEMAKIDGLDKGEKGRVYEFANIYGYFASHPIAV